MNYCLRKREISPNYSHFKKIMIIIRNIFWATHYKGVTFWNSSTRRWGKIILDKENGTKIMGKIGGTLLSSAGSKVFKKKKKGTRQLSEPESRSSTNEMKFPRDTNIQNGKNIRAMLQKKRPRNLSNKFYCSLVSSIFTWKRYYHFDVIEVKKVFNMLFSKYWIFEKKNRMEGKGFQKMSRVKRSINVPLSRDK